MSYTLNIENGENVTNVGEKATSCGEKWENGGKKKFMVINHLPPTFAHYPNNSHLSWFFLKE